MRTQRTIVCVFAACLVSLMAGTAIADDGSGHFNAFLKGQYRVSGTVTCSTGPAVDSIGSWPTLFDTFTGVITYDGHGTATLKDEGVDIGTGSPDRFVDETCTYSYEVARDGSFTQTSSCTDAGKTYLLSGIKEKGQIGAGGAVLVTNQVGTDVETLAVPPGNIIEYRLCGGVGTAVRINPH